MTAGHNKDVLDALSAEKRAVGQSVPTTEAPVPPAVPTPADKTPGANAADETPAPAAPTSSVAKTSTVRKGSASNT
jgi:hypothetical protein